MFLKVFKQRRVEFYARDFFRKLCRLNLLWKHCLQDAGSTNFSIQYCISILTISPNILVHKLSSPDFCIWVKSWTSTWWLIKGLEICLDLWGQDRCLVVTCLAPRSPSDAYCILIYWPRGTEAVPKCTNDIYCGNTYTDRFKYYNDFSYIFSCLAGNISLFYSFSSY